jgi:hypothetical protein
VGVIVNLGDDRGVDRLDVFSVVINDIAAAPDKKEIFVRNRIFRAVQKTDGKRLEWLCVNELEQPNDDRVIYGAKKMLMCVGRVKLRVIRCARD